MGRVTVFGSLHYDILVHAPDRPRKGETVTGQSWEPKFGGKGGNQAVAAARAGAETSMVGAVGDDAFAPELTENLRRAGVAIDHVRIVPNSGSGMSVAIFDSGNDYGAVIVSGANLALDDSDVLAAADIIAGCDLLILQNEIPVAANLAAARHAQSAGVRVILNAAPVRMLSPELASLIDVLVVNAIEAEALAGTPVVDTLAGALAAARLLANDFPVAVVTAGGAGVACALRTGDSFVIDAVKVEVASTHGAGDAFVGTLAAALAAGIDLRQAVCSGNVAAARLVASAPDSR